MEIRAGVLTRKVSVLQRKRQAETFAVPQDMFCLGVMPPQLEATSHPLEDEPTLRGRAAQRRANKGSRACHPCLDPNLLLEMFGAQHRKCP